MNHKFLSLRRGLLSLTIASVGLTSASATAYPYQVTRQFEIPADLAAQGYTDAFATAVGGNRIGVQISKPGGMEQVCLLHDFVTLNSVVVSNAFNCNISSISGNWVSEMAHRIYWNGIDAPTIEHLGYVQGTEVRAYTVNAHGAYFGDWFFRWGHDNVAHLISDIPYLQDGPVHQIHASGNNGMIGFTDGIGVGFRGPRFPVQILSPAEPDTRWEMMAMTPQRGIVAVAYQKTQTQRPDGSFAQLGLPVFFALDAVTGEYAQSVAPVQLPEGFDSGYAGAISSNGLEAYGRVENNGIFDQTAAYFIRETGQTRVMTVDLVEGLPANVARLTQIMGRANQGMIVNAFSLENAYRGKVFVIGPSGPQ